MRRSLLAVAVTVVVLTGCGGSPKSNFPTVGAARTFEIAGFVPTAPVTAGEPAKVSFLIRQPDGKPLTKFRRGPGPHTGVHLIFVRRDLAEIVHRHPPIAADGTISDTITFRDPGPYRLVVDVYPSTAGPQRNFQLFGALRVSGSYHPATLPPLAATVVVDGYRFKLEHPPSLHAIQAELLSIDVTDPDGRPTRFTPWYGALAHAIFFRRGTLDYFHTHVCAAGAVGCTSALGAATVSGSSSTPGKLHVGVLVPVPGTWRLFIQCRVAGRILTAPFTLRARP